jgi:hypothetical protein
MLAESRQPPLTKLHHFGSDALDPVLDLDPHTVAL